MSKKKIRADFRKNRNVRVRHTDWTRKYEQHGFQEEAPPQSERVSGKGELTRKRTVCGDQLDSDAVRGQRGRLPPGTRAFRPRPDEHGPR
jgi:ribosome biogenesis GTPase